MIDGLRRANGYDPAMGMTALCCEEIRFDCKIMSESNLRENWRARENRRKSQRYGVAIELASEINMIMVEFEMNNLVVPLVNRAIVELTSYRMRLLDPNNLDGSFKRVIDGIADAIGYDDGPNSPLQFRTFQKKYSDYDPCGKLLSTKYFGKNLTDARNFFTVRFVPGT